MSDNDDTIKIHHPSTIDLSNGSGLTMIKEHNEETDETIRKQYENMSYDEMTQRLAESYKQLSDILGTRDITPSSTSSDKTNSMDFHFEDDMDDLNEQQLLENTQLDDNTKRIKMSKLFWRAASSGDIDKVQLFLQDSKYKPFIDIDVKDEDGTTPLIYAACFGKMDIAQALLSSGAKIDIQDSFGWSALMWATNNNHEHLVKILLEHGASSQTKSSKGRTVFDFVNTDNQKIVDILATNPRDSISSTSSVFGRNGSSLSSSSSNAGDYDFYYQSTVEGFDNFMNEEADRRKKLLESAMALVSDDDTMDNLDNTIDDSNLDLHNNMDDDDDDDDDISNEFQWDKCLPHQMFVFSADDLPYILDTVITNIQLPMRSQHEICVPANVIFLSARFSHYFSTDELVNQVLDGSLERVANVIKNNARNIHILAFWITNLTQLLHYLKKDTGLVVATAKQQLNLSELISETYMTIINDTERRINKILGPAMLEHDEIPGMDDVNFTDDWHRFFRRSSRRSVIVPPDGALAVQMKRNKSTPSSSTNTNNGNDNTSNIESSTDGSGKMGTISPQSITSLLSSTLFVLQSYDVHPTIIIQALAQFFHYLSCELFNRILTNKKLLCRSKAMQVRMNLSQIEDWICANNMPVSLGSYLTPTTQLLQLLQCLTQLTDLVSFINTVKTFDVLNALQVKRCVVNYRYEVNEPRLPEEIEKYAMQLAEDTIRHRQNRHQQQKDTKSTPVPRRRHTSMSMSRSQSNSMQRSDSRRRESMSHLVGSFMSSMGITTSTDSASQQQQEEEKNLPSSPVDKTTPKAIDNNNKINTELDNDDEKEIKETKDSKFMLPFSVPTSATHGTTTATTTSTNGQHSSSKYEHTVKERSLVPIIPESWMNILDKGHTNP
ncbi:uncharacterized protein BX664DRAFT_382510 [Halteromyces radiatus]|uniref:uncharacterized protein n=1 Tax=Halteromyces radiatus TaxID=101107 RepID=UPI00221EB6B4|nr:uncharacterized protein BX664DRAFT_382510 [Halteromyces radiatus]KAI8100071.1 hypothetical protein BX664DRAFT_382510 [Halteromyces radiatus]